jgi:predicted unusual protein kinase regulating ubiquinone biosynthesis (AarF/ABC1/UbiB family)
MTRDVVMSRKPTTVHRERKTFLSKAKLFLSQAFRVLCRSLYLSTLATPLLITYPLRGASPSIDDAWLRWAVWSVEASGAAVTKLFQWAGSRPDMFGNKFCSIFSKLQDDTTPHSYAYTRRALASAYGEDWEEGLEVEDKKVLGSGCIGQVYKGRIKKGPNAGMPVAIKILHPNIDYGK